MFYLHMKGGEKTPILSNENSNISFYLYKIVKQLLHLSNVGLTFYLIFILNVGPFLYGIFFFLPEASSICLFGLMNGPAVTAN
jgi:hypothetical protein